MTKTTKLITDLAKALNGESYDLINYASFGTTAVANIAVSDTSLSGEIGTRPLLSRARSGTIIEWSGVRSSVDVVDTGAGDIIRSVGLNVASTGGDLMAGVVTNAITHTTAFDIEIIAELEVRQ